MEGAYKYDLFFEASLDGKLYELCTEWTADMQLMRGDYINIHRVDELEISKVVWYFPERNWAFVSLGRIELRGTRNDWNDTFALFDRVTEVRESCVPR